MKKENFLIYISHKTPQRTDFSTETVRPTICLEVGYPEPYQKLLQDADLLLEGSSGGIGGIILIKLEPLASNASEITQGFLEVWKYDAVTGKKNIVEKRRL